MRPKDRRYPLAPFFAATRWTMASVSRVAPCSGYEYKIRKAEGVTALVADRIATRAGLHPAEVWPSWWDDALADHGRTCEGCGTRYLPKQRNQRFCVLRCGRKTRSRERERRLYQDPEFAARKRDAVSDYWQSLSPAARRARKVRERARKVAS